MSNSNISITLKGVEDPSVQSLFGKAKTYVSQFKDSINSSLLNTLGAARLASMAIGQVSGMMSQVTHEAKKFQQVGARLGIDPSEVSKIAKVAEETGTSQRAILKGYNQLKKMASEALLDPTGKQMQVFKQLGIGADQLTAGLQNPTALMGDVSDRLNEIGDDSQKLSATQDIFKANGFAMSAFVDLGKKGQQEIIDGTTTMGDVEVASNAAMLQTWERAWDSIKGGFSKLGIVLNPIVQTFSVIVNLVTMLATLLGSSVLQIVIGVGVVLTDIVLTVGAFLGRIIQAVGWIAKLIGMGDELEKFGEGFAEGANKLQEKADNGAQKVFGDINDKAYEMITGDAEDIGRAVKLGTLQTANNTPVDESRTYDSGGETPADVKALAKSKSDMANEQLRNSALLNGVGKDEMESLQRNLEMQRLLAEAVTIKDKKSQQYLDNQLARLKLENDGLAIKAQHELEAMERADAEQKADQKKALDRVKEKSEIERVILEMAEKAKYRAMKTGGATEIAIKNAQLADELDKFEAMKKEEQDFLKNPKYNEETYNAMIKEMLAQAGKIQDIGASIEESSKPQNAKGLFADSMRKIGGGGAIASGAVTNPVEIAKKSLIQMHSIAKSVASLDAKVKAGGGSSFGVFNQTGKTGATYTGDQGTQYSQEIKDAKGGR